MKKLILLLFLGLILVGCKDTKEGIDISDITFQSMSFPMHDNANKVTGKISSDQDILLQFDLAEQSGLKLSGTIEAEVNGRQVILYSVTDEALTENFTIPLKGIVEEFLAAAGTSVFNPTTFPDKVTFTYTVCADEENCLDEVSQEIDVSFINGDSPADLLWLIPDNGEISLTFAQKFPARYYKVYIGEFENSLTQTTTDTVTTEDIAVTKVISGLTNRTTYYVAVEMCSDLAGTVCTGRSEVKSTRVDVPVLPSGAATVSATHSGTSNGSISINWTQVADATFYKLFTAKGLDTSYTETTLGDVTSYVLTNSDDDATYKFYIKACSSLGCSSTDSNIVNVQTFNNITEPTLPPNVLSPETYKICFFQSINYQGNKFCYLDSTNYVGSRGDVFDDQDMYLRKTQDYDNDSFLSFVLAPGYDVMLYLNSGYMDQYHSTFTESNPNPGFVIQSWSGISSFRLITE